MTAKKNGLSRRNFLKGLGAGSAAMLLPSVAGAKSSDGSEELCTLLDLSRCVGCGECVSACSESNAAKYPQPEKNYPKMYPTSRVKVEDWSEKRDVDDRLTPYNWLFIQSAEVEYNGEIYEVNIPRRCLHCRNAPCANLCPWGAAGRQKNGIVRINDDVCLGGAKCRSVCPWHIPQRQSGVGLYLRLLPKFAGNGAMYKCDRCYDKINDGKQPACIDVCPENVQSIGPRSEIIAKAHELAEKNNWFIYGEDENGGTNTIYVSPVPFDLLNAAIEKGPGKPGLAPVADSMADEEKLAYAVGIAPFAGVVAGIIKAGNYLSSSAGRKDNE
ncbi:4Fe-4S dicluster domain-containing protein [Maridesulfovibrio zosterae]|uniref:4Fe-4S dicluster domain-containing protein n=1 Tax=Maridesulfovibrio zosterae TaxID=82171 RepID=UPI000404F206|nr:4Fe-4S dicluster domain-containing protein [Maridesulfovibrio zosterae]